MEVMRLSAAVRRETRAYRRRVMFSAAHLAAPPSSLFGEDEIDEDFALDSGSETRALGVLRSLARRFIAGLRRE